MGKNAIIFMGPPAFNEVCMSEAPITDTDHVDPICLKVVATSKMRIFIAKSQSQSWLLLSDNVLSHSECNLSTKTPPFLA